MTASTSAEFFLYEHDNGSTIVARADDARPVGNPAWHRVGPVDVHGDDVLRCGRKAVAWL